MALKDLIRKVHGTDTELSAKLDMYLMRRKDRFREPGWHPSEFQGMCARAYVLGRLIRGEVESKSPDAQRERIFNIGSALHRQYQEEYFGPMGMLWGKWRCRSCELVTWGFMPNVHSDHCIRCGKDYFCEFLEVPVRAKIPGSEKEIVGHSDGILHLPSSDAHGLWVTWEFKSINDSGFRFLSGPSIGARRQVEIYHEVICQGHVDAPKDVVVPKPQKILVFYRNKNNSEEKEYWLDPNQAVAKSNLKQPVMVEKAFAEKELPCKWEVCTSLNKKPAAACPVSRQCFSISLWEEVKKVP